MWGDLDRVELVLEREEVVGDVIIVEPDIESLDSAAAVGVCCGAAGASLGYPRARSRGRSDVRSKRAVRHVDRQFVVVLGSRTL